MSSSSSSDSSPVVERTEAEGTRTPRSAQTNSYGTQGSVTPHHPKPEPQEQASASEVPEDPEEAFEQEWSTHLQEEKETKEASGSQTQVILISEGDVSLEKEMI